jgi:hypothetical protein
VAACRRLVVPLPLIPALERHPDIAPLDHWVFFYSPTPRGNLLSPPWCRIECS